MTPEEKIAFLKKMGYGGNILMAADKDKTEHKKSEPNPVKVPKNRVDKKEIINLYQIFNKETSCRPQIQES